MGLVKYNGQTFNVDQIPDGHLVVSEQEFQALSGAKNALLSLKSRIPVGISEADVQTLLEKGQRFDSLNTEFTGIKTKLTETEGKLGQFANIPQDFKKEEWDRYRKREQSELRQGKLSTITQQAIEKAEKVTGIKGIKVDPRFYDASKLEALNVDATDAVDVMYKILDEAHTAQSNFMKEMQGSGPLNVPAVGGKQDTVSEQGGASVARI